MMKQKDLAFKIKTSESYISQLLSGHRRPSWPIAKRLAHATNTTPYLWLEGSPNEIKEVLEKALPIQGD